MRTLNSIEEVQIASTTPNLGLEISWVDEVMLHS
jgi:hypothetical protein